LPATSVLAQLVFCHFMTIVLLLQLLGRLSHAKVIRRCEFSARANLGSRRAEVAKRRRAEAVGAINHSSLSF
jgi:hypothetical protein